MDAPVCMNDAVSLAYTEETKPIYNTGDTATPVEDFAYNLVNAAGA